MIDEGFSKFAVEDFYESFMEQLEKLNNDGESSNSDVPTASEGNITNGVSSNCETDTNNSNDNSKLGMISLLTYKK